MTASGDERGGRRVPKADPPSGPAGLGPVFALMRKWAAILGGGLTLLAAIAFFLQPYTRSTGALVAASVAALAAAALILFGAAWTYLNRAAKMPLWLVIGAVLVFLGAGASLGAAFGARSAPRAGGGGTAPVSAPNSTGATPSASGPTPCPADSAIISAQASLDSAQPAVRLAAISVLRQTMTGSPGEQCAAVNALTAFVRKASPASTSDAPVNQVVQSALTALAGRNPARDGGAVLDLHDTNLTAADLAGANLAGADLSGDNGADLTNADLAGANLRGADLENAYLGAANISNADFAGANLTDASFFGTALCSPGGEPLNPAEGYDCTE